MFGYLQVDKKSLEDGQRGLYQSFMCGLCFSTKKHFTNKARITISYDVNFFNVLFHSFLQQDATIVKRNCMFSPIKKRTVMQETDLTDSLSVANVLLVYLNLYDDVVDGGGWKKKFALKAFTKDYNVAKQLMPQLDADLTLRYNQLRQLEKENCSVLDKVCHPFAQMSRDFCKHVLQTDNSFMLDLCYNVGKWVYLIDALDDLQQDLRKGVYNPIARCFGVTDVKQLSEHLEDISFLMYSVLNRIAQCYNDLNLTKYTCLLNNLLFVSLRNKTKSILDKYLKGEDK